MESGESTAWLRSGAPALVVRLLRLAGLAPLRYGSRGVRVSRALSIYGKLVVTAFSAGTIYSQILDVSKQQLSGEKFMTTSIVWTLNAAVVVLIPLIAAYFSTYRMEKWMKQVKRIAMVKSQLGVGNYTKATRKKLGIITVTLTTIITLLMVNLINIYMSATFLVDKIIEMHLLLTYCHIASLLSNFKTSVEELVRTIDGYYHTEVAFQHKSVTITNIIYPRKVLVSPRRVNPIINVAEVSRRALEYTPYLPPGLLESTSPKWNVTGLLSSPSPTALSGSSFARKQQMRVRQLNAIYTEICELVDTMNHGIDGIMMSLSILNCTVHLIMSPYNFITALRTQPLSIKNVILEALWLLFHFTDLNMIIAPGHRIIQRNEDIKIVVGKLMGKAYLCGEEMCGEVQKLFITLILNRPMFSPLGICTFSRTLLLSVLGLAATYLVVLEQFRTAE